MHVGLIVDGVRRWARREDVQLGDAYARALVRVDDLLRALFSNGATAVSLYLLSRDNLQRSADELRAVFDATAQFLATEMVDLAESHGVGFAVAGDPSSVPDHYRSAIENLLSIRSSVTASRRVYLVVAYSPAEELAARWRPGLDSMSELIAQLWVPERLDLVIRTGGSALLSDFLPLQCGYARLWCSPLSIAELTWDDIRDEVIEVRDSKPLQGR